MADDAELERRIREEAFKIWIEEGRPSGRDREHWELAKMVVAQRDGLSTTLVPPQRGEKAEPIEAVENQGEFPTLVDQGEQQIPKRKREND